MATKQTPRKNAPSASAKKTAVTVRNQTAVSVDVSRWQERLAAHAARGKQQTAKAPADTGNAISFRGGTMTYQGYDLGHELDIVVLHPQFERVYYASAFDPNNIVTPDCYSYDGNAPHPTSVTPQSDSCQNCQWNAFDTAKGGGRGKACREGLKLAVLPAGECTVDEMKVPLAVVKLSPLNAKDVRVPLDNLYAKLGHPCMSVCTLTCNPDPTRQILNTLTPNYPISEESVMEAISERLDEAEKLLLQPYMQSTPNATNKAAPGKPRAGNRPAAKRSRF